MSMTEAEKTARIAEIQANNHYPWLEANLVTFLCNVKSLPEGYVVKNFAMGLIRAHGDKCYTYRDRWRDANIPFAHGVAIYLLSYLSPYSNESRDTTAGWVDPWAWVIANYRGGHKFIKQLPSI